MAALYAATVQLMSVFLCRIPCSLFNYTVLIVMASAVQCFGRKRNATAVAHCKEGKGVLRVNGYPVNLVQPETLRVKVLEPVLLLGPEKFANLDVRIRVKGGGHAAQIYAIRQALAKAIVSYYQKCKFRSPVCLPLQ